MPDRVLLIMYRNAFQFLLLSNFTLNYTQTNTETVNIRNERRFSAISYYFAMQLNIALTCLAGVSCPHFYGMTAE